MKPGDKVILLGFIDGFSYETTGQTNFIIALETGERVEVPIECVIKKEQVVKKDEIKLKDVIRRINRLDENSKTYWLDTILNWFSLDFGLTKYRQGYEQGKIEGEWVGNQLKDADKIRQELNKPVVPLFVADFITEQKKLGHTLSYSIDACMSDIVAEWYWDNSELFARAWLYGYTVEEEKRYEVILCNGQSLKTVYRQGDDRLDFEKVYGDLERFTRKQLEEAGFGWMFDCPGIEIREATE